MPKEWYRAVKFLIDGGKLRNAVLIVTGSSSMAVKREVELFPGRRGRGRDFVAYPLSFRGFLKVVEPQLVQKIPVKRLLYPSGFQYLPKVRQAILRDIGS